MEQGGERGHAEQPEPHPAERAPRPRDRRHRPVRERGDGNGFERARQRERRRSEAEVDHRRGPEARPDADVLDQEESGERRAGDGAQGVDAVQPAQRRLQAIALRAHERAGEDGEGAAHQGGRDEQH